MYSESFELHADREDWAFPQRIKYSARIIASSICNDISQLTADFGVEPNGRMALKIFSSSLGMFNALRTRVIKEYGLEDADGHITFKPWPHSVDVPSSVIDKGEWITTAMDYLEKTCGLKESGRDPVNVDFKVDGDRFFFNRKSHMLDLAIAIQEGRIGMVLNTSARFDEARKIAEQSPKSMKRNENNVIGLPSIQVSPEDESQQMSGKGCQLVYNLKKAVADNPAFLMYFYETAQQLLRDVKIRLKDSGLNVVGDAKETMLHFDSTELCLRARNVIDRELGVDARDGDREFSRWPFARVLDDDIVAREDWQKEFRQYMARQPDIDYKIEGERTIQFARRSQADYINRVIDNGEVFISQRVTFQPAPETAKVLEVSDWRSAKEGLARRKREQGDHEGGAGRPENTVVNLFSSKAPV